MNSPSWVGRSIGGRYQIEALLGQGGMSAVYRATDPNLRRTVAVKLIHPHLSDDPEFVRRFELEAAAVAQLRHPNIIQVYDFNHDAEVYYMVLEYVAGETLQSRLRTLHAAGQRLGLGEAAQIMATVCDAVEYAHRRGMIHRDLKPANVMLEPQGQPILMDFGVAKIVGGQQHTATGAIVGTVAYMSPEQIRGSKVDERADLYSLGIMLYEMTAGRPPFEGDSAMTVMFKHVNEPPPDIQQYNAALPLEFKDIIFKALEKDPARRYQTAAEMARDLRALRLLQTAVTPPGPATEVSAPAETQGGGGVAAAMSQREQVRPPDKKTVITPPAVSTAESVPPARAGGVPRGLLIGGAVLIGVIFVGLLLVGFLRNRSQNAARVTATARAVAVVTTEPAATPALATATRVPPTAFLPTLPPTQPPQPTVAAASPTRPAPTPAPATPTRVPPTPPPPPEGMLPIPAGSFNMGSDQGAADERPVHPVTLRPFFLDQHEVTNAQYSACVEAGQCSAPAARGSYTRAAYFSAPDFAAFPVLQVTWEQAVAFCGFVGKRLPSEAEWEYAARGGTDRRFPWGNEFDPARVPATVRDTVAVGTLDNASPFGVLDMAGNVNEWVADWYARVYNPLPDVDPLGPDRGTRRVYRGGSFDNRDGAFYTTTRRYNQFPAYHDVDIGFRCAQNMPVP